MSVHIKRSVRFVKARGNPLLRQPRLCGEDMMPGARTHRFHARHRGSSLIEVMLAVAVMAASALGLIAGQLWTAREARAMSMREHAAWIADLVVEAVSASASSDSALNAWRSRAATLLPQGDASVMGSGGVAVARVTWTVLRNMPRADDMMDKPEPCGGVDAPVGSSCVALAFVK